jgi:galactokinase
MVFLARADGSDEFIKHLEKSYQAETGIAPTIYRVEAADGTQIVPMEST